MKKKFWSTFLISVLFFSILFIKVGPYFMGQDTLASEENVEEEDIRAQEVIKEKGEIIFLLMGIDDEYSKGAIQQIKDKREDANSRYFTTGFRSDTMILCKYNFDTGDITMLSIPRDTRTKIRGRKNLDKINHAHSYGGPNLSIDAVRDLLDVDLDYFVSVDFLAVKEIVNAIGGVEIDIPQRMKYTDTTKGSELFIDFQPGLQTLDGQQALEYLRFRSYPNGDVDRVKAQQVFLKQFAKQVLRPKNIMKLPKMVKTYFDYVDTNIPFSVVMKGIGSVNKVNLDNIDMSVIPGDGEYINHIAYFLYDENSMRELVREKFGNFLLSY